MVGPYSSREMALVIVPVKPLARAKRRLAPALSEAERRGLCLAMLADVCGSATASFPLWVVTSDDEAAAVAVSCGAEVRRDPTPLAGLNPSLEAVVPPDPDGVLIVSCDVPAASPEDVRALATGSGVTLAPDRGGAGTNALWRSPADAIPLAFGLRSRAAHQRLAAERGIPFRLASRPGLALDVDTPADLADAWTAPIGRHTRRALEALGFPERMRRLA